MKLLLILATLFSVQSFAAITICSGIDKDGNELTLTIDPERKQGEVISVKDGREEKNLNLKIYIMNHNSPGFYFYEGLATIPHVDKDAELFRLKLASDNVNAKLVLTTVGGSNPRSTNLECKMK